MALVIKEWSCQREADEQGNFVKIVGREGGLIAWLLSLVGIDPVSEVEIKEDLIKFTDSSLAGKEMRVIPIKSVTSAYFAYGKPWKVAAGLIVAGLGSITVSKILTLVLVLAGIVYYVLNKSLSVAVVEASGWVGDFSFKRSIIEGQNIDEQAGNEVIDVIRHLIQAKTT
ncbi:MAG: hypothetical protein AAGL69_00950 [Pseudomonadota bacterium]